MGQNLLHEKVGLKINSIVRKVFILQYILAKTSLDYTKIFMLYYFIYVVFIFLLFLDNVILLKYYDINTQLIIINCDVY